MSSQKGNDKRSRAQSYKNKSSFKNNLHDTSRKTKIINDIEITDVCQKCRNIIDWKIKYKKYKLLTVPRKCVQCEEKNVKQAYTIMCRKCSVASSKCAKCCSVYNSKDVQNVGDAE